MNPCANDDWISADLFAGGGGASTGIELALGRPMTIAVNHCKEAIEVHSVNHPATKHYLQDIWAVNPRKAVAGRRLKFLWMSASCTHHSRAKNGVPLDRKIRGLSWVGVKWAREVKPEIIIGENVIEVTTWGPLLNNLPDPKRKGETFRKWVKSFEKAGYHFEWRRLRADLFGVPTARDRFYFIASRTGKPIVWPEPTHGPGLLPLVPARTIIDFTIPSKSVFDRKKPLVVPTFRRLAAGLQKFVLKCAHPVVIDNNGKRSLAFLAKHYGGHITPGSALDVPIGTITAIDHHALVQVDVVPEDDPGEGENEIELGHFLVKYFGQGSGAVSVDEPLHTITSRDRFGLVTIYGVKHRITDIRMRMLTPRELFNAMGFPSDYRIDRDTKGKPIARGKQVMLAGNSVCPKMAEILVRAQM